VIGTKSYRLRPFLHAASRIHVTEVSTTGLSEGRTMACHDAAAFGIFANVANAEAAIDRLTMAGFPSKALSVLLSDKDEARALATTNTPADPEGATAGVGVGGVVGGALGLLAGIGVLALPGVGPFIVAGPIMATLAGLGVGGAVGGFVGALVGMGIPEFEAKLYDGRVKDGGVLLAVHCESSERISRAKDVLKAEGAEDIATCLEESLNSCSDKF
jgi:hypothetical protein